MRSGSIPFLLLLSIASVFTGCRKEVPLPPLPSYTAKMGGVRNWHGNHYYTASGIHFPTPIYENYALPDTSFALVVIDNWNVKFLNSVFEYTETDSANQIFFFGTASYFRYGVGTGIAYYYAKDSIVYCHNDVHGTNDFWQLKDLYYTY